MFVYKRSESGYDNEGASYQLFTVGHYTPGGEWNPESDHATAEAAGDRARYLNGGHLSSDPADIGTEARALAAVERIADALEAIGEILETKRIRVEVTGP